MAKKVLIGVPAPLLAQVDFVAEAEHRTRSDLMREALRRYVASFRLPEIAICVPAPAERCTVTDVGNEQPRVERPYANRMIG